MESLIRYVATECRYEIESYTQYVKDICSRLESRGMISYMLSEPSCTKKVAQLPDSGEGGYRMRLCTALQYVEYRIHGI